MKRVKLYTSVAQVDGVTYSPGDVIELSDEDAQYLIDHGQGVETTDQVTDVAAREAAEGTDHAIRVDVQHGEAQDIITVVPSDPDKKLPASEGGDDPDPAPADDAKAAGSDSAGDEPQGSADAAPAEPTAPAAPADDAGDDALQSRPQSLQSLPTSRPRRPLMPLPLMPLVMRLAQMRPQSRPMTPLPLTPLQSRPLTQPRNPKKRGRGRPRKNS